MSDGLPAATIPANVAFYRVLQYLHGMYRCLFFPYPIGHMNARLGKVIIPPDRAQVVIDAAYLFIRDWRRQTRGPNPYIEVRCFGEPPQRVYINPAFHYIEKKHPRDIARRYRFLPCVKELLSYSTEIPVRGRRGNLELLGQAPPFKEKFVVLIEDSGEVAPGLYGHKLVNFYPAPK